MTAALPSWPVLLSPLLLPLLALAGWALDRRFGEVGRWHPLVGFGTLAQRIEALFNPLTAVAEATGHELRGGRPLGILAWAVAVLPPVALAAWLCAQPWLGAVFHALCLYFALGQRSLAEHGARVADDLARGDLAAARTHVGWMVSRDTSNLDESGVAKAGVESLLENGNDAVFGALFWFLVLGGPGAVLFRLANTLDAMWGYRTPRFLRFGWAAARIDDLLNWVPARLTALTYALLGDRATALACWKTQAPAWDSPNAGPVMAAGAGSLGVQLGGAAIYHGVEEVRPPLGAGRTPDRRDLGRALVLIRRSAGLWLAAALLLGAVAVLTRVTLAALTGGTHA